MRLTIGKGIDQYISNLQNLDNATEEILGKAIYEAADIVADAVKKNIEDIPIDEGVGSKSNKLQGIKSVQKQGLIDSFGIAPIQENDGYYNVKLGFDGRNHLITDKYPNGQKNVMVARLVEAGNSFTQKHPFVGPAVRETRERAERRMAEVVDNEMLKYTN